MDRILIQGLQARCIIGVNADERIHQQDVVINLARHTNLSKAGRSDRLEDAVDYAAVKKEVLALVERSQFVLLEALAEAVADLCLRRPAVAAVTVRVDKPGALSSTRSVAVEIERARKA
jgi:FolB domain-containing protein